MKRTMVACCAALPLALACGDELTGPEKDIRDGREAWEDAGLSSYEYEYHQSCFCALIVPVRIIVEADSVVAAFFVEGEEPLPPDQVGWLPTVDDLFDRLEDALARDPVQYRVEYDAALGYPTSASVDVSHQIADEEFSFTASDLAPLDLP